MQLTTAPTAVSLACW